MDKPWAVIRPADDGTVDDVAISGVDFRMEAMSDKAFWIAVYQDGKDVHFWLQWDKKQKKLIATCTTDEIGCVDDR
jgi:hypothetical protein